MRVVCIKNFNNKYIKGNTYKADIYSEKNLSIFYKKVRPHYIIWWGENCFEYFYLDKKVGEIFDFYKYFKTIEDIRNDKIDSILENKNLKDFI